MPLSRAEKLIDKLIRNQLNREELSELLDGITSEKEQQHYSDVLEIYFNRLLNENRQDGTDSQGRTPDL